MPTYCYTSDDGVTIERTVPVSKMKRVVRIKGKAFYIDIGMMHAGRKCLSGNWPLVLKRTGVAPHQVPQVKELLAAQGCPTEFNERGKPIITSYEHYKKHNKLRGLCDFGNTIDD